MFKNIILKLIKLYQISPLDCHNNCKFIPSCSEYAYGAIEYYGVLKGTILAIKRILKCNPFNKGGYNPLEKK